MSFRAEDLRPVPGADIPLQSHDGKRWIIAKPLPTLLRWRIRQAWLVLTGRAEIIVWPKPVPATQEIE